MAMVTALLCHKSSKYRIDANALIAKHLLSVTYILIFESCTFSPLPIQVLLYETTSFNHLRSNRNTLISHIVLVTHFLLRPSHFLLAPLARLELPLQRASVRPHNQVRNQHQHEGIHRTECIAFEEAGALNRREHQHARPCRRTLGYQIHDHEDDGALRRVVPQHVVGPAVENAALGHRRIGTVECEPFGGFGNVPHSEDNHGDEIPRVGEGNGPAGAPEEVGAEVDKEDIEYTKRRGRSPELVYSRG